MGMIMVLLIGVAVFLIYQNMENKHGRGDDSPLDTVKRRYARGEITFEEFEQIKKDLE